MTRTLRHYRLEQAGQYSDAPVYAEGDSVTFACLPGVPLTVGALFAGAPSTEP
jgi:hypothetical protein